MNCGTVAVSAENIFSETVGACRTAPGFWGRCFIVGLLVAVIVAYLLPVISEGVKRSLQIGGDVGV